MAEAADEGRGRVSLHNRRVAFRPADIGPGPLLPDIAPLVFSPEFETKGRFTVDLRGFPLPGVAAEAARLLWKECGPTGHFRSVGTADHAVQALRRFGEMVVLRGWEGRIRSLADLEAGDIEAFEDYLHERHGANSATPYTRIRCLLGFLRLALAAGLAHERLADRLRYVSTRGIGTQRPREPYPPAVAEQMRQGAAKDMLAAIRRIDEAGAALIARGQDPDRAGWAEPANVAWAMAHRGLTNGYGAPPELRREMAHYDLFSGTGHTFADLVRHVHLTLEDATAFMVFLSLETGLPIESVRDLEVDCLHNEARGYVDVRYTKRRRGTGHRQLKRVRSDGPLTAGGAIKALVALTRWTREWISPTERGWLFVGHGRARNGGTHVLRRLRPNHFNGQGFCARHAIVGDDGAPLPALTFARLRKTYKAERYRAAPNLAALEGDHTRSVHDRHYADVAALRPIHEQTVADALQQALDSAMRPVVVPSLPGAGTEGGEPPTGAAWASPQAVPGAGQEADVWLAGCLDHDNSPFQPPASGPCRSPVWGCLGCRNAVITTAKLPAILAFLGHLVECRGRMDLRTWGERYGEAYGRIVANILPRFPAEDIAAARAVAAAEGDLLWLPAELTHSW